jgi:hypothetical protein
MTLHVSGAKQVLNPYDWLPPAGESGVRISSEGLDVVIEIFLSTKNNRDAARLKRELRFFGVCSFRKDSFPGPVIPTSVSFDDVDISEMFGSLIEFEHSDVADAWTAHFNNRRRIRHYLIHFLSEQVTVGIFAAGYELGEETSS